MSADKRSGTTRNLQKDYDISDVEHLMRVRAWRNYTEMIDWLKRDGYDDNELTPGEVDHLVGDLSRAVQRKTEFTSDPQRLYKELKRR
jgi:hypothetical protein